MLKIEEKTRISSLCNLIYYGKQHFKYETKRGMHVFVCVHATRKEPIKFYQQLIYAPNLKGRHYIRIATAVIACLVDAMSLKTTRITEKVSGEQTGLRAIEACVCVCVCVWREEREAALENIHIYICNYLTNQEY